ncbi:MAG: imidazoleglycerol-phosphate dehydratase HisB [Bacteroidetes bacterium]|jgi:imidazoleglycerol phosphate dehydratase HisB|nr:imidazoleglycerol-phosphate dehydratase HisB [Bacteroidota bacterium]
MHSTLYLHTHLLQDAQGRLRPGVLRWLTIIDYLRQPQWVCFGPALADEVEALLAAQGMRLAATEALPEQLDIPAVIAVPTGMNLPAAATLLQLEADMPADWQLLLDRTPRYGRIAEVHRQTSETDIRVRVNLDGSSQHKIDTGLGFFDHMLEQLARHGGIDLEVRVTGDLHIDEHHTIEDTALALGEAFKKALGDKRGLYRYGFLLPMDEALAQVAIDFGGRPWLVWDAAFKREKIGDMPTEMFFHFFKSFSDAAACNLNMQVTGENEHHKIEALFKAWAKAIKMALTQDPHSTAIPSTKGTL